VGVAPGRVNLIGEHVDYVGGLVLPAAIDRATAVAGAPSEQWEVRSEVPGGERYVRTICEDFDAGPFRVAITSTLPPGAGLSSSAALLVATAAGLKPDLSGREAAIACQAAEQRASGVQVGIMDQFASALGRKGNAMLLNCASYEHLYVPFPDDLVIAVVDSGLHHDLASTPYNERRREVEEALATIAIPLFDLDPADDNPRLRHVVTELRRVRAFTRALETGDRAQLGPLLEQTHRSLRDDFQVSVPEIDALVERAMRIPGCLGARIMGAGFGGSVLALLEAGSEQRFSDQVGAPVIICRTADGAYSE
jgi:galactokinase